MIPLIVLSVILAVSAGPIPDPQLLAGLPLGSVGLTHLGAVHAAPAVHTIAAPAVHTVSHVAAAPAISFAHHVPLTKTVHFENRPVVTGFRTEIIKPAIATHTLAQPIFAAPQPIAIAPAPVAVETPVAVEPAVVEPEIVADAPIPIQFSAAPVAVQAVPHTILAPAPARFIHEGPFVSQEPVLAPVRTHTQITPQVTQVVPEVHVQKTVQEVHVPQTIHVQHPSVSVAAPSFAAHPAAFSTLRF